MFLQFADADANFLPLLVHAHKLRVVWLSKWGCLKRTSSNESSVWHILYLRTTSFGIMLQQFTVPTHALLESVGERYCWSLIKINWMNLCKVTLKHFSCFMLSPIALQSPLKIKIHWFTILKNVNCAQWLLFYQLHSTPTLRT